MKATDTHFGLNLNPSYKGLRITYRRQPEELPGQGGVSDRLSGNSMERPLSEDDVPLER